MIENVLSHEELMFLHRHWMWANLIKQHFDAEFPKGKVPEELLPDRAGAHMQKCRVSPAAEVLVGKVPRNSGDKEF